MESLWKEKTLIASSYCLCIMFFVVTKWREKPLKSKCGNLKGWGNTIIDIQLWVRAKTQDHICLPPLYESAAPFWFLEQQKEAKTSVSQSSEVLSMPWCSQDSQSWVRHVSYPVQILYDSISESSLSICALPSPWQPRIFSEKSASH